MGKSWEIDAERAVVSWPHVSPRCPRSETQSRASWIRTGITHRQISMLRFDSSGLAGVRERVISTLCGPSRTAASDESILWSHTCPPKGNHTESNHDYPYYNHRRLI